MADGRASCGFILSPRFQVCLLSADRSDPGAGHSNQHTSPLDLTLLAPALANMWAARRIGLAGAAAVGGGAYAYHSTVAGTSPLFKTTAGCSECHFAVLLALTTRSPVPSPSGICELLIPQARPQPAPFR